MGLFYWNPIVGSAGASFLTTRKIFRKLRERYKF